MRLGSHLAEMAREVGGLTDAEAEHFNQLRNKTPAEPISFDRPALRVARVYLRVSTDAQDLARQEQIIEAAKARRS